jgi:hypothetical protein
MLQVFGIKAQGGFAPFLQNRQFIGAGNFLFGMPADMGGRAYWNWNIK